MALSVNYLDLCRICLREGRLFDILLLGTKTRGWIKDIRSYYKVQLNVNDDKSTKLCSSCIRKVHTWRKQVNLTAKRQRIINYLDRMVQQQKANPRHH